MLRVLSHWTRRVPPQPVPIVSESLQSRLIASDAVIGNVIFWAPTSHTSSPIVKSSSKVGRFAISASAIIVATPIPLSAQSDVLWAVIIPSFSLIVTPCAWKLWLPSATQTISRCACRQSVFAWSPGAITRRLPMVSVWYSHHRSFAHDMIQFRAFSSWRGIRGMRESSLK